MQDKWFQRQHDALIKELADNSGTSESVARHIYNTLCDRGFIDYDIEKELFWEMEQDA